MGLLRGQLKLALVAKNQESATVAIQDPFPQTRLMKGQSPTYHKLKTLSDEDLISVRISPQGGDLRTNPRKTILRIMRERLNISSYDEQIALIRKHNVHTFNQAFLLERKLMVKESEIRSIPKESNNSLSSQTQKMYLRIGNKADFSKRLIEVRKVDLKLNQTDMANLTGALSQSYYSKIETGFISPTDIFVNTLKEKANINPSWLIFGDGDKYLNKAEKEKNY